MSDRHADAVGRDRDRDWKAVREQIGLTRQELAAKLGVSIETVRMWEIEDTPTPSIAYQRDIETLLEGGL